MNTLLPCLQDNIPKLVSSVSGLANCDLAGLSLISLILTAVKSDTI